MEKSFAQISELFAQFSENAKLQMEKGNKAAGTVPAKHHSNSKNSLNNSERNRSKHRNSVISVSRLYVSSAISEKSLSTSQRGGFFIVNLVLPINNKHTWLFALYHKFTYLFSDFTDGLKPLLIFSPVVSPK